MQRPLPSAVRTRRLPVWAVGLVAAVLWWVVGALPWVAGAFGWGVGGMRLPVQNLWSSETAPEAMPVVPLPFSQYFLSTLVSMTTIGGVVAGLVALLAHREHRGRAVAAGVAGGLVAALIAIGQTALVVQKGLEPSSEATLYLAALVGVCALGTVAGLVSGALLVAGPRGLRAPAAAVASVALGPWLGLVILRDPTTLGTTGAWLLAQVPWVTALVLGAGLALTGLRPASRLVGWGAALVIAWVAPAALTAVSYVGGSARGMWRSGPAEMLDAGRDVFVSALAPGTHPLGPFALALVVGLLGSLWLTRGHRADDSTTTAAADPVPTPYR